MQKSQLLRNYLFIGGIVLIAGLLIVTDRIVRRLEEESRAVSFIFAQFAANTASTTGSGETDPKVQQTYRDVISQIDFPLILTDRSGTPRVWRHVGVEMDEVTDFEISALDPENPPETGALRVVLDKLADLDAQNDPIPIQRPGDLNDFGHVHYGTSPLLRQLRFFPLIELSMVSIFMLLAVLGYRSIKENEQRSVWVGMAKETAHQLGTPISSLMGWLEVLREQVRSAEEGQQSPAAVALDRTFLDDVLSEMDNDAARLEKIAARFSNVGSAPRLLQQDIVPVVGEATHYLMRRLPHMKSSVEITEHLEEVPPVNINRELMEWVMENLLKNALDSVDREDGHIHVEVKREPHTETVDIRITDNGRGMTAAEQRRVFEPGYSTKRRGWGLGLSLSRRIVEEYHGGRLLLERSAPGEGTTFVVQFPV